MTRTLDEIREHAILSLKMIEMNKGDPVRHATAIRLCRDDLEAYAAACEREH